MATMRTLLMTVVAASILFSTIEGFRMGKVFYKWRGDYNAYLIQTADVQPDNFIEQIYVGSHVESPADLIERKNYLIKNNLSIFHNSDYEIPEQLRIDSLGQFNDKVLYLAEHPLQLASDFLTIVRPVVAYGYTGKITNLYLDVDGQIFPLYYNKRRNSDPVNPNSMQDVSAIAFHALTPGIHHAKIKALASDGSYYIASNDMVFESK
jgi:hypothetical protein